MRVLVTFWERGHFVMLISKGMHSFNPDFWTYLNVLGAIQPKFPRWGSKISWCRMDPDRSERPRSIPLAKRVSRSINEECWITVARIKATWRFRRWYQWYCASCFIHSNLTSITGYFKHTVPRYLPCDFIKHHVWSLRIKWRKEFCKFFRQINLL